MINLLHLDDYPAVEVRREYLLLLKAKREHPEDSTIHQLFLLKFGYPQDLPDLSVLQPPQGNSCLGSEQNCYHARHSRGELREVY